MFIILKGKVFYVRVGFYRVSCREYTPLPDNNTHFLFKACMHFTVLLNSIQIIILDKITVMPVSVCHVQSSHMLRREGSGVIFTTPAYMKGFFLTNSTLFTELKNMHAFKSYGRLKLSDFWSITLNTQTCLKSTTLIHKHLTPVNQTSWVCHRLNVYPKFTKFSI